MQSLDGGDGRLPVFVERQAQTLFTSSRVVPGFIAASSGFC